MATYVHVNAYIGDPLHCSGKTVNLYGSTLAVTAYNNALAHASTGLLTAAELFELDQLTGSVGDAITQVAKITGLIVDQNGMIHCIIDTDEYIRSGYVYAMMTDEFGPPRKVRIVAS